MAELIMTEETSVSAPSSGSWKAYFKSTGIFVQDDAGNETGPLAPSAGFSAPLYLDNTASDIGGYKTLTIVQPTGSVQTDSVSLSAADTVINEYATVAGLFTLIPAQVVDVHLHLTRTAGTKGISAYVKLYHRTSGGTETLMGTSATHANVEATEEHDFDVAVADTAFIGTDRFVLKVYGTPTGAGTAPTLTVSFQGTTYSRVQIGAQLVQATAAYQQGYLFGLTLSNNGSDATNDIDIAAGKCRSSDDGQNMVLSSALTKRLDAAWAVGTGNGGLDTGSIANTTYHIWLIKRSDTGVVDALFSTSASAPTMPANYDYKRRIGSIVRTGGAIKGFIQDGDNFSWKAPVGDVAAANPGTSAVTRALTLPTGIRIQALITALGYTSATANEPSAVYISDLSCDDVAATAVGAMNAYAANGSSVANGSGSLVQVFTDTSAQVRSRLQASSATTTLYISTLGWIDSRGRLA